MPQAKLEFDARDPDPATAFEIGRDFAQFGLTPPLEQLAPASALLLGWESGRASLAERTLAPSRHVRRWLQLRLSAWRRSRVFEGVQVTPNYLRQIDVDFCPVTRQALGRGWGTPGDACVDRVRDDAGVAAGNLVVMSAGANAAKGGVDFDGALASMRRAEAIADSRSGDHCGSGPGAHGGFSTAIVDELGGLSAAEWSRIAILVSFVTELPHEQAAALPLLVLPPNRLRLFNPIQALQALVTRGLARPGWSAKVARLAELMPGNAVRRDFQVFVHALLPRVLEAGWHSEVHSTRWALEDAWRHPLVMRCWSRFARQLSPIQAEQLAAQASALRVVRTQAFTLAQATEGWALAQQGHTAAIRPLAAATGSASTNAVRGRVELEALPVRARLALGQ